MHDDVIAEEYDQLRRIAHRIMRGESRDHTWQPTDLVHVALLRANGGSTSLPEDRAQFLMLLARIMRNSLIDYGRRKRKRLRREEGMAQVTAMDTRDELVDLSAALEALAGENDRQSRVLELHWILGFPLSDVAQCLGVSVSTVKQEHRAAKDWLRRYWHAR